MKGKIVYLCRSIKQYANYVAFVLSGYYFRNKRELSSLRGIYKGKRCFVVCNGPSLHPEDLTKIFHHDDVSIAMNMIGRVYDKTPWRPNLIIATDGICFSKKNKPIVMDAEADYKGFRPKNYLDTLRAKGKRLYYVNNTSRDLLENPRFSMDLMKGFFSIGTTAYEAFQWATYLGCKEIFLIGCDMSYTYNLMKDGSIRKNEAGQNHFYSPDDDTLSKLNVNPTWEMEVAYEYAEKYSKEHGFRIYNATRGGYCEAFERVDFDALF